MVTLSLKKRFRQASYDLGQFCERCGVGLKQTAPFQMIGEPKWGKRGILQLNWVFDQFFATPGIWASVFDPHGVASRVVTDTKGRELKTVVQLVAREEIDIATASKP